MMLGCWWRLLPAVFEIDVEIWKVVLCASVLLLSFDSDIVIDWTQWGLQSIIQFWIVLVFIWYRSSWVILLWCIMMASSLTDSIILIFRPQCLISLSCTAEMVLVVIVLKEVVIGFLFNNIVFDPVRILRSKDSFSIKTIHGSQFAVYFAHFLEFFICCRLQRHIMNYSNFWSAF